jgi:hypothetical protein
MPTTPGKRRSRTQWEDLMVSYEASNKTQRQFCSEHEIAYSSFCYWRKRLRRVATSESTLPKLIELPALEENEAPVWRIELDLGAGIVLRIR